LNAKTLTAHLPLFNAESFISGLCVGLAITSVPPLLSYIATTSPSPYLNAKRGLIGTLNQFGIVLGILSAQLVGLAVTGMRGDRRGGWRYVVAFSGVIALAQMALGTFLKPHVSTRGDSEFQKQDAQQGDEESEGKSVEFPLVHDPSVFTSRSY
jgi:MFS family permease